MPRGMIDIEEELWADRYGSIQKEIDAIIWKTIAKVLKEKGIDIETQQQLEFDF